MGNETSISYQIQVKLDIKYFTKKAANITIKRETNPQEIMDKLKKHCLRSNFRDKELKLDLRLGQRSLQSSVSLRDQQVLPNHKLRLVTFYNDKWFIRLILKNQNYQKGKVIELLINESDEVIDLKERVAKIMECISDNKSQQKQNLESQKISNLLKVPNIMLTYKGQELENYYCLANYGIVNGDYILAQKIQHIDFNNRESLKQINKDIANNIYWPPCNFIKTGFVIRYICQNPNCIQFQHLIYMNKGFGKFNLLKEITKNQNRCPLCFIKLDHPQFAINKSRFKTKNQVLLELFAGQMPSGMEEKEENSCLSQNSEACIDCSVCKENEFQEIWQLNWISWDQISNTVSSKYKIECKKLKLKKLENFNNIFCNVQKISSQKTLQVQMQKAQIKTEQEDILILERQKSKSEEFPKLLDENYSVESLLGSTRASSCYTKPSHTQNLKKAVEKNKTEDEEFKSETRKQEIFKTGNIWT